MTTETLEQVESTQAEAQQVSPTTEPEGSQSTEAVAEGSDEEAIIGVLKATGHYGSGEETDGGVEGTDGAKAAPAPEVQSQIDAAVQADRAERERKAATEYRASEEKGIRESFEQRKPNLAAYLAAKGLTQEDIAPVLTEFDRHHGQSSKLREYDIRQAQVAQATQYGQMLYEAAGKMLPKAEAEAFASEDHGGSLDGFFKSFRDRARKGYLSPAEVDKRVLEGVKAYEGELQKKGLLAKGRAISASGNGTGSGGVPSMATWQGYTLEQRAEAQKRDPQILEKIMRSGA